MLKSLFKALGEFGCIVTDLLWPQDGCVTPQMIFEAVCKCCRVGPSRLASFTLAMQGHVTGSANRLEIIVR